MYEQILITASKRSTGLQETPIAVSVTSGEAIEQTQVLDIQDLQALVPTLENLVFSFAGTILDPVYDSFVGANGVNGPIDLSGTQPAGIHERSFVAGLTYHVEFENGTTGFIRSDYLHESETQLVENVPPELTREVNMLNASAGLTFTNGISVQLWVRNLNDDEYYLSAFPPPIQAGSFNAYPSQPRTFGATISYMFD